MNIETIEESLLKSLEKFYSKNKGYLVIIYNVINQNTLISLREIDYLVTNYSKINKVSYMVRGSQFYLHLDYKSELKGYSKKLFDSFRRRSRVFVNFNTGLIKPLDNSELDKYSTSTDGFITTVAQLNFFRWAISNDVISYCFKHKEQIVDEMKKGQKTNGRSDTVKKEL